MLQGFIRVRLRMTENVFACTFECLAWEWGLTLVSLINDTTIVGVSFPTLDAVKGRERS
jgi:glucokinase